MPKHLFFFLFLFTFQNLGSQDLYFPPADFEVWEEDEEGCAEEQLAELGAWLSEKNSKSFMILQDGKILTEMYFDDFTKDSIWYWASAGKSLMAVLLGKAQQEGALTIEDAVGDYLGSEWTSCSAVEENAIQIKHQISMTTGLDESNSFDCTDPECLQCLEVPGERWFYHNAPYTLTQEVLKNATGLSASQYFKTRIGDHIGASGLFINLNFNKVFFSRTRDMARFGLLVLANGNWAGSEIYESDFYFAAMSQSSQNINPAYGYLWWLNGKENYKLPGTTFTFNGALVPTAPDDMFAAMGKNDQRLYIVPSQNLVVVRLGNVADELNLALSDFDVQLWEKISALDCLLTSIDLPKEEAVSIFPNPTSGNLKIEGNAIRQIDLYDLQGNLLQSHNESKIDLSSFSPGLYLLRITGKLNKVQWEKVIVL